jgi:threonine/homoserine/homoserine lactone efflux protein
MPDTVTFGLYLTAAIVLAITPGPGIFYVLTRSIKGGRGEGYASALGTAAGGLFHVFAAALGLSAILATSALAFNLVKYIGAAYLIYMGIRTLRSKDEAFAVQSHASRKNNRAFYQGVLTEMLNPKTALFFLAFIPQFVNPLHPVVPQFMLLGCISVFLNTSVDFVVATLAGPIGTQLQKRVLLRKGQRIFSGCGLIALGTYVAFSGSEQKT